MFLLSLLCIEFGLSKKKGVSFAAVFPQFSWVEGRFGLEMLPKRNLCPEQFNTPAAR